jgi:hypothetical protein
MIAGPSPTPPGDEPLRDADPFNPDTLRVSPGIEAVAEERRCGFCVSGP